SCSCFSLRTGRKNRVTSIAPLDVVKRDDSKEPREVHEPISGSRWWVSSWCSGRNPSALEQSTEPVVRVIHVLAGVRRRYRKTHECLGHRTHRDGRTARPDRT